MARESGINCLLKLSEDDSPETWVTLAGQRDCSFQGQANEVDSGDKTTGGWDTALAGTRSGTVNCSGVAVWPDTTGVELLRQRWDPSGTVGQTIRCKLEFNSTGAGYVGDFHITNLQISGDRNGVTEYSVTLRNAAALDYTAA